MCSSNRFVLAFGRHHDQSLADVASNFVEILSNSLGGNSDRIFWGVSSESPMWKPLGVSSNAFESDPDSIHALLDALPPHRAFLLDILWFMDKVPSVSDTRPDVYGALKRARDWHCAVITIVCSDERSKRHLKTNPLLLDLEPKIVLPEDLKEAFDPCSFWRGRLSFLQESDYKFRDLPDISFELIAEDAATLDRLEISPGEVSSGKLDSSSFLKLCHSRLSGHLQVLISVHNTHVPQGVRSRAMFKLRVESAVDDAYARELLEDPSLFGTDRCLLTKLQFCHPRNTERGGDTTKASNSSSNIRSLSSKSCNLTAVEWKKRVAEGGSALDAIPDPDQDLEDVKEVESLYFVLFKQGLSSALDVTAALVDVGSVIAPNHLKGLKQESVVISGHQDDSAIDLSKLLGCHGSDHSTSMHSTLDEISWPERRLLALIEQSRKSVEAMNKAKVGGDGLMTPSCGDFVILESGELLRLLKEHEKKSEESLEVVVPKRVIKLSAADHEESQCASWPEVLYSEHPCLQYNRGAKSESLDRELQRIQRAFVGLGPKETASSTLCHKDEKCQIVVAKKKVVRTKQEKRRQSLTHEGDSSDKRVLRSSGPMPKDELLKRKIRNAVYEALLEVDVSESHPVFKPCFKRLFDVCFAYAKGFADAQPQGMKQLLKQVATSNVRLTVDLEKAARSKKK